MGARSVPERVRATRPGGTTARAIGGHHCACGCRSAAEGGRRRTRMGRCVGKAGEGRGYVPDPGRASGSGITTPGSGDWAVALSASAPVRGLLGGALPRRRRGSDMGAGPRVLRAWRHAGEGRQEGPGAVGALAGPALHLPGGAGPGRAARRGVARQRADRRRAVARRCRLRLPQRGQRRAAAGRERRLHHAAARGAQGMQGRRGRDGPARAARLGARAQGDGGRVEGARRGRRVLVLRDRDQAAPGRANYLRYLARGRKGHAEGASPPPSPSSACACRGRAWRTRPPSRSGTTTRDDGRSRPTATGPRTAWASGASASATTAARRASPSCASSRRSCAGSSPTWSGGGSPAVPSTRRCSTPASGPGGGDAATARGQSGGCLIP